MELVKTKKLLEEKLKNKDFETYAVLVHSKGEETRLYSDDADEFTYFDVASMGKVLVTSTLILQAISRGMLTLESTLDEYFDVKDEKKKKITVKQLITHTSGIIRYNLSPDSEIKTIDEVADEIMSYPPAYEPGTNYIYSCNGFILLGFILEKIYKMPLEEIYMNNIAKPLKLKRTSFKIGFDEPNSALCCRYREGTNGLKRFDDENVLAMGIALGNGGQQSCIYDIKRFIDAVLERSSVLYSEELYYDAETNQTPSFGEGRGLGYLVVDEKYPQTGKLFPVGSFGHCGHTGQSFFINREKGLYVIILTNATRCANAKNNFKGYDYGDIMKMREEIHNAIAEDLAE